MNKASNQNWESPDAAAEPERPRSVEQSTLHRAPGALAIRSSRVWRGGGGATAKAADSTGAKSDDLVRVEELIADRALNGELSAPRQRELQALLKRHPEIDADEAARAAEMISRQGEAHAPREGERVSRPSRSVVDAGAEMLVGLPTELSIAPESFARRWRWLTIAALLGWIAAAIATIALVRPMGRNAQPSIADQRVALLSSSPNIKSGQWMPAGTIAASPIDSSVLPVGQRRDFGDVIWSDMQHRGFARLRQLPPNDPADFQYQLWVYDADRDARYPVDAGVFNVRGGTSDVEELMLAIAPRLKVSRATSMIVTRESPSGSVVADAGNIVRSAQIQKRGD